jgi:type VI secretion system protein ImpJ
MFLRPQHFQQQDRYVQQLIETRCASLRPYGWGFAELQLDDSLLLQGKLALSSCRGLLPDGTPFACSTADDLPAPLEVPEGVGDTFVHLVLPLRRPGALEIQQAGASNGIGRYQTQENDVRDSSSTSSDGIAHIQVGSLNLRLILAGDDLHEYASLGVARIIERRADNSVILDEQFIPPCLDCRAAPRLAAFINEIVGLLNYRGEAIAGRVTEAGRGGVAEFADFLLLMLVNRMELLFQHLATMNTLHPEMLYETCLQLAGELATFTAKSRRPAELPAYRHEALAESFVPLMEEVRRSLRMVLEQNAIAIPLEKKKFNMFVAAVPDRGLLENADFVLAVNANISGDRLRRDFPSQTKIGPVEKISELVNLQLPGVGLNALPVAPRQIPYHAGSTYFELDRSSDFWKDLEKSGGFAMHVAGEFPGLDMACWAIRG